MKIQTLSILLILFLFSINLFAQEKFTAKVVGVASGDTITVLTKEQRQLMFQLAGIDAPEREQDYEVNARFYLADLVLNKTITVSNFKKDCLDRFTASVAVGGKDLSFSLIQTGNAWADSTCQTNEILAKEETTARERKIGLWQNPNPVRPQEFLKQKQEQAQATAESSQPATGRRIFTGLAPIPPPPRKGLYIGMALESFETKCGKDGKMSKLYTAEGYQSFDLSVAETAEGVAKGCAGTFTFTRYTDNGLFTLRTAFQIL